MLLSHIYISHIYLTAATYIITGPHTYTISRYIYYIIRIHIIHITMHADILSSISRHDSHVTSRATSLAPPMRLTVHHTHRLMSHFFGSTFHSFIVLSAIAHIYIYRYSIAPFVIRLILLYINWVYTSCLLHFEYCAAPIVLTSGFGAHSCCDTHNHTTLSQ